MKNEEDSRKKSSVPDSPLGSMSSSRLMGSVTRMFPWKLDSYRSAGGAAALSESACGSRSSV
ncbi:hypothetical protein CCH79_00000322 [Gambusia affinis]|uniref:Uncharacterized protein n=1 Tax=Gambusia affinis TaxID=33528 RepID=A0A315VVS3_GAMAF|nr:hypothetical protein CCH79_00000322 [Gambusia affinis]